MEIKIKIRTLTPLWTGDVDRKCSKIKETGIIGSLRWWYEALVRGFGGYACDPTKSNCENLNHCNVCKLFGCTGWSRKLKIKITQDNTQPEPEIGTISLISRKHGKTIPKWYFPYPGREGLAELEIVPLKNCSKEELNGLKITLKIIEKWGAIGSRTHLGYGVFQWVEEENKNRELSFEEIKSGILYFEKIKDNEVSNLPDLKYFFFGKFEVEGSFLDHRSRLEKSLELRYDLRQLFRNNKYLRYNIMGTTKGDKKGSKIFISRVYQIEGSNEMRIWGWIPPEIKNRDGIIGDIYDSIQKFGQNLRWREFDSDRDTCKRTNDISEFVGVNLLEVG